jgi:hypothetical protein
MSTQQPYITMFTKGEIFEGRVVCVSTGYATYQDKLLWTVTIRNPVDTDMSAEPKKTDFQAQEVTSVGQESIMRKYIGDEVRFVIISPGKGSGQLPWIKVDQPKIECNLDEGGKIELATQSYLMASDLICSAKAEGFNWKNIDELASKLKDKILVLSKQI